MEILLWSRFIFTSNPETLRQPAPASHTSNHCSVGIRQNERDCTDRRLEKSPADSSADGERAQRTTCWEQPDLKSADARNYRPRSAHQQERCRQSEELIFLRLSPSRGSPSIGGSSARWPLRFCRCCGTRCGTIHTATRLCMERSRELTEVVGFAMRCFVRANTDAHARLASCGIPLQYWVDSRRDDDCAGWSSGGRRSCGRRRVLPP